MENITWKKNEFDIAFFHSNISTHKSALCCANSVIERILWSGYWLWVSLIFRLIDYDWLTSSYSRWSNEKEMINSNAHAMTLCESRFTHTSLSLSLSSHVAQRICKFQCLANVQNFYCFANNCCVLVSNCMFCVLKRYLIPTNKQMNSTQNNHRKTTYKIDRTYKIPPNPKNCKKTTYANALRKRCETISLKFQFDSMHIERWTYIFSYQFPNLNSQYNHDDHVYDSVDKRINYRFMSIPNR